MRLLNLETLQLESYTDASVAPPYAILSHTWGSEEVTLQMLEWPREKLEKLAGWAKIVDFCSAVQRYSYDGSVTNVVLRRKPLRYGWVDTCCIDKTSSAELSEAINSMYQWYSKSDVCLAFLADVAMPKEIDADIGEDFERSRWFTRGWTLQELLAPSVVVFYDGLWTRIGTREQLALRIAARTKIDVDVLLLGTCRSASVAQRMSWASGRETTRREDIAYSLLGLFDVNMPLLYGEGDKAFLRLQEEIMKESNDQSILAWDATSNDQRIEVMGGLAGSPSQFHAGANIEAIPDESRTIDATSQGIQIHAPIFLDAQGKHSLLVLSCRFAWDMSSRIGIPIHGVNVGQRCERMHAAPTHIPVQHPHLMSSRDVVLAKRNRYLTLKPSISRCWVSLARLSSDWKAVAASPPDNWHFNPARSVTMIFPPPVAPGLRPQVPSAIAFRHKSLPDMFCLWLLMDGHARTCALAWERIEDGASQDGTSQETAEQSLGHLVRQQDSLSDHRDGCHIQLNPFSQLSAQASAETVGSVSMFSVTIWETRKK
jgi:hypothetical protein